MMVYLYDIYQIMLRLQRIFFPNDNFQDQMKQSLYKLNIKLRTGLAKDTNAKTSRFSQTSKGILLQESGSAELFQTEAPNANSVDFGGIFVNLLINIQDIMEQSIFFILFTTIVPLDRDAFKRGANDNLVINQVDKTKSKKNKRRLKNKATKQQAVISRDYTRSITMSSNNGKSNAKKKAKHDIRKQQPEASPKIAHGPSPRLSNNKKRRKKKKANSFIIE